jgi:hypothetical protein
VATFVRALSAVALVAAPNIAHAQGTVQSGARCEAGADCLVGLRCLANVCVDDATFEAQRPDGPKQRAVDEATHGYLGGVVGASLPVVWGSFGESAQLALRAGVLFEGHDGHAQLQLEVSPGTTILSNVASQPMGLFDAVGTIGYLAPIGGDVVSWIVRIGGGGGFVFNVVDSGNCSTCPLVPFGEFRVDVFGAAIRPSRHLLIEVNVPSFRILAITNAPPVPNGSVLLMWVTNVALSYVF